MTDDPKPWFPIHTERLLLREFRESDLGDIHAYAAVPEVSRFMTWGPNTPDDSRPSSTARSPSRPTGRGRTWAWPSSATAG
jgi:RimJ/RimL family protein N-acetyltransferase